MIFRKAEERDLPQIVDLYSEIHTEEENGKATTGWNRKIYPTESTAKAALERNDIFVAEDNNVIVGTAIINQNQGEMYFNADWKYKVPDSEIMVLHTLVITPKASGKGYGKSFVRFYEEYALSKGCHFLRMDTNEKNIPARTLYKRLAYEEIGKVQCAFNGIESTTLVLIEKKLGPDLMA